MQNGGTYSMFQPDRIVELEATERRFQAVAGRSLQDLIESVACWDNGAGERAGRASSRRS